MVRPAAAMPMNKIHQSPDYYDRIFATGGYEGVYDLPYRHSAYYPLFKAVLREVRRLESTSVLEVGCGTGGFARYLQDAAKIPYRGFDFSAVAVAKAAQRTGHPERFHVANATHAEAYAHEYDTIVCTEVLEHIEHDLEVIANWRCGSRCVCSVPNFDAESHVRHFRAEQEVRDRYEPQLRIDRLIRIRKPVLSDISARGYLRALRWNRYRPRMLAAILGLGTFDALGGWFLFSGVRR